MIRVLHSVSNMDRAGIETMLMNYYRHMDRSKVQFDFLCNKKKHGAYDEEIKALGGKIYHTPGLNPFKYPIYLRYMKQLFQEYPEYQIIEAHNGALGVYALYAAKENRIPVRIFHAHGASIAKDWKLPLKWICKAMLPFNMNQYFSCGSEAARCYFGNQAVKGNLYEWIPNAIEVERFIYDQKVRERIRREYGLEDKRVIGHVGRFMAQKNHMFLVQVLKAVCKIEPNVHLVLLGDGELRERVKKKAEHLGVIEQISFIGNVSNANEWYQAFDCFVLPSVWEGLPVVGVEAQAADLPCVFSASITPEIKFSDRVKFVSLKAPKSEWAREVCAALQERSRSDQFRLIQEKHYDIQIEAKKLQDRYLELAGEAK